MFNWVLCGIWMEPARLQWIYYAHVSLEYKQVDTQVVGYHLSTFIVTSFFLSSVNSFLNTLDVDNN